MFKNKFAILSIVIPISLFILGNHFSANEIKKNNLNPIYIESELKKEITSYNNAIDSFIKINTEEIRDKIINSESFFLYTGRITCEWCRKLVPVLSEIMLEKNITIFYLDSENTTKNIQLQEFRNDYNIEYVPSIIFFDESQNYYDIEHNITSEKFNKELLEKLIKPYI